MATPLKIVLSGIGGYGGTYVHRLLDQPQPDAFALVGVVDPYASASPRYGDLVAAGIPVYPSLDAFFAEHSADLACLCCPIQFHKEQTLCSLRHGVHVLCEKPVCPVIDDVREMIAARDAAGKAVSIGYQWSHSAAIQALKRDVLAGKYGKALRMKTIVLWPRNHGYFHRGIGWAAHKKDKNGSWILDSVAANATAHYLHNMLYVAGPAIDRSARVAHMQAETYRANDIEMYDTCALRLRTDAGTEMLYLVSHAVKPEETRNPEFVYEFERGTVFTERTAENKLLIRGRLSDGAMIEYGCPDENNNWKIDWAMAVARGEEPVLCGLEAASEHTRCINRIEELIPESPRLQNVKTIETQDAAGQTMVWTYAEGLATVLNRCYGEGLLPCETGAMGFAPAREGDMTHYDHFSGV